MNSGDPAEAASIRDFAETVFLPGRNLGYAGGLNAGVERSRGATLVLANPDLFPVPGSLPALLAALEDRRFSVAGPSFFLDEGRSLLMPPSEMPHPLELARRCAALDPATIGRIFSRARRRVEAQAEATRIGKTREVRALSGALLVTTRSAFERVGPFDEGYSLYFEEHDWERRLLALGGVLLNVGSAHVIHHYNQSAQKEPRAAAWFAESERRFFASHFGARGLAALATWAGSAGSAPRTEPDMDSLSDGVLRWSPIDAPVGVALSPLPSFLPFAYGIAATHANSWHPPADVLANMGDATWYARAFNRRTGLVLAQGSFAALGR